MNKKSFGEKDNKKIRNQILDLYKENGISEKYIEMLRWKFYNKIFNGKFYKFKNYIYLLKLEKKFYSEMYQKIFDEIENFKNKKLKNNKYKEKLKVKLFLIHKILLNYKVKIKGNFIVFNGIDNNNILDSFDKIKLNLLSKEN